MKIDRVIWHGPRNIDEKAKCLSCHWPMATHHEGSTWFCENSECVRNGLVTVLYLTLDPLAAPHA